MARRQREWAKRKRLELVSLLGGRCVDCGEDRPQVLCVDHKLPRRWDLRKLDPSGRVSRYFREFRRGVLTVRCVVCNSSKAVRFPAALFSLVDVMAPRPPGNKIGAYLR